MASYDGATTILVGLKWLGNRHNFVVSLASTPGLMILLLGIVLLSSEIVSLSRARWTAVPSIKKGVMEAGGQGEKPIPDRPSILGLKTQLSKSELLTQTVAGSVWWRNDYFGRVEVARKQTQLC